MKRGLIILFGFFFLASIAWAGTATLSWTASTTRCDGTILQLSDISGYRVYYGIGNSPIINGGSNNALTNMVNIDNPGVSNVSTTLNLSPGNTYVFAVTEIANGVESNYSNEVSLYIPYAAPNPPTGCSVQ